MSTFKYTIVTLFLLVSLIPILGIGFAALYHQSRVTTRSVESQNAILANAVSRDIQHLFEYPRNSLQSLSRLLEGSTVSPEKINRLLDEAVAQNEQFELIYRVDKTGQVINVGMHRHDLFMRQDLVGLDLSSQNEVRQALDSREIVWSDSFLSMITGQLSVSIAVPSDTFVLFGTFSVDGIHRIIQGYGHKDGIIAIIDRRGLLIFHPDKILAEQKISLLNVPLVKEGLSGQKETRRYTFNQTDYLGSICPIPELGWLTIVSQPAAIANTPVYRLRLIFLVGMCATAMISVFSAFYLSGRITRPLTQLSQKTHDIACGNYQTRLSPQPYREIEALAGDFRDMASAVNKRETMIKGISKSLAVSTGQECFDRIVAELLAFLQVESGLVGELLDDDRVRTLSVRINGVKTETIEYDLKGTPCQMVTQNKFCHYPENVQQLFPDDPMLVDLDIQSYVGFSLTDSYGNLIGIICGFSSRPLALPQQTAEVLHILASRAFGELERLRSEEKLRLSEERYAMAQKAAHVGSWDWDIQAGRLGWSEQVEPLFGYQPGTFAGTYDAFMECVHPEDRLLVMDAIDVSIHKGKEYAVEHRILWPDGTVRWVSETGDVTRDFQGKAIRMLGIVCDVTARKQAEDKLRFQALILNQIQDHITVTDMDGIITYVNQQQKTLFQESFDSLIGKHVSVYGENPQEGATQEEFLVNTRQYGKWRGEIVNYDSEGQSRIMDCRTQIIYDENGQARGMVGIASDITERKRIEKQLTESEERYRSLVEYSPSSVVIMQNRKYAWANTKTLEMLGLKNIDQLNDQDILRYVCPEYHDHIYSQLIVAEQGKPTETVEVQLERVDHTRIWIEVRSVPISYQGQPATLIVSNDITTRKIYELQKMEYQNELKKLVNQLTIVEEAERKRIAAELHDQIGQSLVFIKMKLDQMVQTLADTEEKATAEELSLQLRETIRRSQSLTYDLGSIMLYEKGLCNALEEWIYEDFVQCHPIEIYFTHNIQHPLEDHIKYFLFRAARELLVNMTKHAQASKATITITEKDGLLHLTVEDDGVGYKTSIRMKKEKNRKKFGLLSIQERLEYLKGKIIIDSDQNHGTKITIVIPIESTNQVEDKQQ